MTAEHPTTGLSKFSGGNLAIGYILDMVYIFIQLKKRQTIKKKETKAQREQQIFISKLMWT